MSQAKYIRRVQQLIDADQIDEINKDESIKRDIENEAANLDKELAKLKKKFESDVKSIE